MGSYHPTDSSFYSRRFSQSTSHHFPRPPHLHPQNVGMQRDHQEPNHGYPFPMGRRPDPVQYPYGGPTPAMDGDYYYNRCASWEGHYSANAATNEPHVNYPYGRSATVAAVPPPPPPSRPPHCPLPHQVNGFSPSSHSLPPLAPHTLSASSHSLPPLAPHTLSASSHSLPPLAPHTLSASSNSLQSLPPLRSHTLVSASELLELVQRQAVRDHRDYFTVVGLCRSAEQMSRAAVEHILISSNVFFFQQGETPVVEEGESVRIKWHTVKIAEVEYVERNTNPPDSTLANPPNPESRDNEREERAQRKRQMEMEEEEKRKSEEEKKKKRVETTDTVRQNPVPVVVEPQQYIAVEFIKSEVVEENADDYGRGEEGEKQ